MEINERRSAPRFTVKLSGTAQTQDNGICPIKVFNISSSGLQFSVAQHEMPKLLPNVPQENNLSPISIQLNLELIIDPDPDSNTEQTVSKIQCGIVYVQRSSLEECTVGCRFEEFFDNANEQLEHYIHLQSFQQIVKRQ